MTDRPPTPRVALLDPVHGSFLEAMASRGWESSDLAARQPGWEEELSRVHILVVRSRTQVDDGLLGMCPRLRAVGRAGTGTDNVDASALERRGVGLVTAPGSNARAVVEHTWALILAALRHVPFGSLSLAEGHWEKNRCVGREVLGKTLGVVGLGRVGREVARLGIAFGMQVVSTDPFVSPEGAGLEGVLGTTLDALLARADIVTLHLPLDGSTYHLLDEAKLGTMKPGALLVNTARGGLVDEAALLEALRAERLGGAAIDVFENEPGVSRELVCHPRVVATPHVGGSTVESQERVGRDLAAALAAWWESSRG